MINYFDTYFDPSVYSSPSALGDGYGVTIHTGPCKLLGFDVINAGQTQIYAQVFDGLGNPIANAVPKISVGVASGVAGKFDPGMAHWVPMATGLTLAASSTATKYTAVATGMFLNPVFYTV